MDRTARWRRIAKVRLVTHLKQVAIEARSNGGPCGWSDRILYEGEDTMTFLVLL